MQEQNEPNLREGDEFYDGAYGYNMVTVVDIRAEEGYGVGTVRVETESGGELDTGLTPAGFIKSTRFRRYVVDVTGAEA